ncbi:transposase [Pantoea stewartii]|uniref:Transposase n=1 Tax=Pantoea stewartii TaxID=66269 RepID=A0AB34VF85_9GAMM|nr:transposase [Pantoea stewartii]KTS97658.1 transposase [Pantoea stewartii]KTT05817.1 transposase [Pantoea stewartii]
MKYVFIQQDQAEFCIKAMCRVLRVARSGWYAWQKRRTVVSTHQQFRRGCEPVPSGVQSNSSQEVQPGQLT